MGGNDRPYPSLPIKYKYRKNNELSPFPGGKKYVLGMIFLHFSFFIPTFAMPIYN